jgi:hypothetical protein
MPMVPSGFVNQAQLSNEITTAIRKLGKEVVRVNYSLGTDSSGEPSIFFRIVLFGRSQQGRQTRGRYGSHCDNCLRRDSPSRELGSVPLFQFPEQIGTGEPQRSRMALAARGRRGRIAKAWDSHHISPQRRIDSMELPGGRNTVAVPVFAPDDFHHGLLGHGVP